MLRYYAQHKELDPFFAQPVGNSAWQVFDREKFHPRGDNIAVCACHTRADAFAIRDALNEKVQREKEQS